MGGGATFRGDSTARRPVEGVAMSASGSMSGTTPLNIALAHAREGRPVAIACPPAADGACACGGYWDEGTEQLVPHPPKAVGKAPIGRLMLRGVNDATTNTATIDRWWRDTPAGNVNVDLKAADWVVVDPDSPEAEAAALSRGLAGGVIRESRNPAYVFTRQPDCPAVNLIKADGDPLDVLALGNFVVYGTHQTGCPVRLDPGAEPGPAPAWVVDLLKRKAAEKAAQEAAGEARRAERGALYGTAGEPPVRLHEHSLKRWRGEVVEERDGRIDRSDSLFFLGLDLAMCGATEGAIVAALEERDAALGWHKFSNRSDDREYVRIAEKAVAHALEQERAPRLRIGHADGRNGTDLSTLTTLMAQSSASEIPWPDPLEAEALHGLTGDVVRTVSPHTEADPAAILAHFLSGAGVLLGKETHAIVGDAQHPPKLSVLVIGPTSKGRKGTAQRATERVFRLADGALAANIVEGLSSGEGLIWQVRDPIYKWEKPKGGGQAVEVLVDPGVDDKRLLVVESEFATTLRVMQRDGNTLTAIVRRAWDRDDLRTLTKNSPARATGAHVAIVGHVSWEELLRYLDRSELANGFANRFLVFAARRSQLLPEGDGLPDAALLPIAERLAAARAWAQRGHVLRRDDEARAIWHTVYADLSRERPDMFGLATNRAEAQVVRLSVLYAALDCSELIRAEHLMAALAVWRYCEQSARWAFGDATGDPTTDAILAALRRNGDLDRDAIYNLLGRHVNGSRIEAALGLLLMAGTARMRPVATGGRPREVWHAT
jgi:hypothetical protein